MKIGNTGLSLTMTNGDYIIKCDSGLSVRFSHYNSIDADVFFFNAYKNVGNELVKVCEMQGKKAVEVYDAVNNFGMR